MSDNKRYYWLKLKEDFFDEDTIVFIEEQPNGIVYSNFYLKLCLKSLKTDGKLIRLVGETLIPYDVKSLSKLTNVDIDVVQNAMILFERIGLIKILETGEIYLSQLENMVGSESNWAKLKRNQRSKLDNVQSMSTKCLPEKEIDIEKDIEKESDINFEQLMMECLGTNPSMSVLRECVEYREKLPDELIKRALEITGRNNAHWSYTRAILDNYIKNNIKTVEQAELNSKKRKTTQTTNENTREYDDFSKFYAN